ncbi:conserved hypothetical protein [Candidatus Terasakiella magnetica]|uniref:Amphi-Trp domain-containing protein n=1 Tax=Candidatus Terasakiella magnetica TaxID=1867952 RepID=A0A1C3RH27_9PROT|nr:amphi-Trp domain-containing protein [Candidatus Terasakiella magnetica]SCA56591.1 conserved hypothetical protein [Candidatus Terasakiella magnetica]
MKSNTRFRHESLQDQKSIVSLLESISSGLAKGKISLEDEKGELIMSPQGLLRFKVSANKDDGQNKLNIRISWQDDPNLSEERNLKISD